MQRLKYVDSYTTDNYLLLKIDIDKYGRTPAPNTGLAKVAVQCSADTFVVKIATFAKPETVMRQQLARSQEENNF